MTASLRGVNDRLHNGPAVTLWSDVLKRNVIRIIHIVILSRAACSQLAPRPASHPPKSGREDRGSKRFHLHLLRPEWAKVPKVKSAFWVMLQLHRQSQTISH
jgi:hypothetical protein